MKGGDFLQLIEPLTKTAQLCASLSTKVRVEPVPDSLASGSGSVRAVESPSANLVDGFLFSKLFLQRSNLIYHHFGVGLNIPGNMFG